MKTLSLKSLDHYRFLLFAWLLVVVIGTLAVFSYQTSKVFIEMMRPDLEAKAVLVSESIAAQFKRAAELEITIDQLKGLPSFLDDAIDNHPDVAYAVVVVPGKGVTYSSTKFEKDARVTSDVLAHVKSQQVNLGSRTIDHVVDVTRQLPRLGPDAVYLHVGVDENFIQKRLSEIKIDLFITLFVAVIITLEVLVFVMMLTLDRQNNLIRRFFTSAKGGNFSYTSGENNGESSSPLIRAVQSRIDNINQRYQALLKTADSATGQSAVRQMIDKINQQFQFADPSIREKHNVVNVQAIRLPLFMFFFATDMSRPFWPTFVGSFPAPLPGMDHNLLMALPMAMWALTMMAVTPFGPRLVQALGLRRALLWGMVPAGVGILMCALSTNYLGLVFWRCVTAAGFGMVTVAGMLFVTMQAEEGKGARSAAIFIGAQTAAGVCGTAIGGILADRLGYSGTLLLSAAMVGLNCMLVMRIITPVRLTVEPGIKQGSAAGYMALIKGWRFIGFVPLAALPPRIVLTGFLLYMIPVSLHHFEYSDAAIGRFMMCYFISNILFTSAVARLLDRLGGHRVFLVIGTALLSGAIHLFSVSSSIAVVSMSMVLLGLGMSMASTALVSIIPSHFATECAEQGLATVTSLLRMVERVGSVLGPLFVAYLIKLAGYEEGAVVLAYLLTILSVGLAIYFFMTHSTVNKKVLT